MNMYRVIAHVEHQIDIFAEIAYKDYKLEAIHE